MTGADQVLIFPTECTESYREARELLQQFLDWHRANIPSWDRPVTAWFALQAEQFLQNHA